MCCLKVLSTIGDSIDAESLKRDCLCLCLPLLAVDPKVLRNACPRKASRGRVPQSWPVNARAVEVPMKRGGENLIGLDIGSLSVKASDFWAWLLGLPVDWRVSIFPTTS